MSSEYSTSRRSGVKAYYPLDINEFVSAYLKTMKDRSQKAVGETAVGSMLLNTLLSFVIGQGLEAQSAPENTVLKWSDKRISRFMDESESFFRQYANSTRIDFYGRCNFAQLQQIAFREGAKDGDSLLHRSYRRKTKEHDNEPWAQVLSGKWVRNPEASTMDTKKCIGGVQFDDYGREKGYHIAVVGETLEDTLSTHYVNKYNPATGFEEYRLVRMDMREANQVRGIPFLQPVLEDIFDLETFKSAYKAKAATQALFTGVITSEKDAPAPAVSTLETIKHLADRPQDAEEESHKGKVDDVSLGTGNIIELNPGEKFDMAESKVPATDYAKFVETELAHIAAGCGYGGLAYEMVLQKYSNNYSASRATIAGQEKKFRNLRESFAFGFCQPIWEQVIDYGIRKGYIDAPGYLEGDWRTRQAILSCTWIGPSPININPKEEIEAHVLAIGNNLETKEDAIRELFGKDGDETLQRRKKEIEAENGLPAIQTSSETKEENVNEEQ